MSGGDPARGEVVWQAERWGLLWQSRNRLDGETRFIICDRHSRVPALFNTRREARAYANEHYGYIKKSPDLRREPHGWKFPKAVKLTIACKQHGAA